MLSRSGRAAYAPVGREEEAPAGGAGGTGGSFSSEDSVAADASSSGSVPASAVGARLSRRKQRAALAEDYAVKMHAALWVAAAVAAVAYTDFFAVCLSSEKVNRTWFSVGVLLLAVAACLVLYMAVYVPRVLKSNLDPSVYSPKMLPVTGIASLAGGFCLIAGLWPEFGLFTPGLLGLLWVGGLMTAHFLPAC